MRPTQFSKQQWCVCAYVRDARPLKNYLPFSCQHAQQTCWKSLLIWYANINVYTSGAQQVACGPEADPELNT